MTERATLSPRPLTPELADAMVNSIKGLTMDAIEAAGCGHPGMPMGAADMATVLWGEFLVHDPSQADWADRDRFVLSAGHGSMLLYSLLHLTGYELPIEELQNFRQWGSLTPGHPEYGHTPGVDVTTGPLGTGVGAGVGMALAERFLADRYNRDGHRIVDHFTYGIVGDGDLMEGVAAEAASLAGHWGLGKLIYLYDDNQITIDGGTDIAFTEDVKARFQSYGWQVLSVDGHDRAAIREAILSARAEENKPTLIACRTVIGKGSPNKEGTSSVHGAKLGAEEVRTVKEQMGWPETAFYVPEALQTAMKAAATELTRSREAWDARFTAYAEAHPELAREFQILQAGELPEGCLDDLPSFEDGESHATRKVSGKMLAAIASKHPTFLGGSADLAGSNCTVIPEGGSQGKDSPSGRNLHFGVREHGMAAICNGLALHGGVRTFDATFLVFSDFMRGGIRLSALMKLPVVHVLTHDSFFLGEDGPTHQPIEHTMSLRAIPDLWVLRPADARETVGAWKLAMRRTDGPTAILLTRQNLPVLAGSHERVEEGAYVVWEADGIGAGGEGCDGILVASGSEVHLAVEAAQRLQEQGRLVRVVSMPSWEAFEAADAAQREKVLPPQISRRLSIEAGTTLGWDRYASQQIGIDHFGASAPAGVLAARFGFSVEAVVERYLAL